LEKAQKQQRLAARLVQQYGLPSIELDRLTSWIDTEEKHLAERSQASSGAVVTQEAMEEEKKIPVVEWQKKELNYKL
jgi:hypothetical protein